jgi:hypothetical protein
LFLPVDRVLGRMACKGNEFEGQVAATQFVGGE